MSDSSLFISLQEDSFYLLDLNETTAFYLHPPFPLPPPSHDTCLLHSRGFICLPLPDYITIWDPSSSLAKFISSPKPNLTEDLIGFGYDSVNDDYKIVMVFNRQESYIYSLKYNAWKASNPIPNSNCVYKHKTGTFVKNCIYWIGLYVMDSEIQDFILCFDLVQESYELVCKPVRPNEIVNSWLGISRGEICVIDHYPNLEDSLCKWSPLKSEDGLMIKGWFRDLYVKLGKSLCLSVDDSSSKCARRNGVDVKFACIARDEDIFIVVKGRNCEENDEFLVFNEEEEDGFVEVKFNCCLKGFRYMCDIVKNDSWF